MSLVKNTAASAFLGGTLLMTAGLGTAMSQPDEPPPGPDGLVTVLVDGATAQDSVALETAAAAAAEACAGDPAAILGLAQQADTDGASQEVCANVSIIQNTSTPTASLPAESTVEAETPAVPGAEEAPAGDEGAPVPAVPGEGAADEPFNTEGG